MAKLTMQGISAYTKMLGELDRLSPDVCKAAVYAGAGVVADEIRKNIDGLKRVSDNEALAAYQKGVPTLISVTQKNGLRAGFGISPIKYRGNNTGFIDARVGFEDYNGIETKRWPDGQPNIMIAAQCEHGSSAIIKQPFVRPAVSRVRDKAIKAMDEAANKKVKEIIGG